jgi:hypothetical protein
MRSSPPDPHRFRQAAFLAECAAHDLTAASAALLELHKHKGVSWEPADHGFVFSKCDVERFAQQTMRLNEAHSAGRAPWMKKTIAARCVVRDV